LQIDLFRNRVIQLAYHQFNLKLNNQQQKSRKPP
jgi:hypothetical protein